MKPDHHLALSELGSVLDGIDCKSIDTACHMISGAKSLLLYGCGREGLQMRGFAMRLYHWVYTPVWWLRWQRRHWGLVISLLFLPAPVSFPLLPH